MGQTACIESRKFKPGDMVRLKSGGPCMVVKYLAEEVVESQDQYWCCWFTPQGEVQSAIFPVKVLVKSHPTDNLSWYRMT